MNYQAEYSSVKLRSVAIAIKAVVDSDAFNSEETIPMQMINNGIRKLHDNARSSRGKGKYLGHPLWSKNALKYLHDNGASLDGITKYLSHEHLIPLKVVVSDFLCNLQNNAPVELYESTILKYSAVAIITRKEDQLFRLAKLSTSMPDNWDKRDVFSRYKSVGLYDELVEA